MLHSSLHDNYEGWGFSVGHGPSAHGDVRNMFGACGQPDIVKAAGNLANLHNRRLDADYLRKEDIGRQKTAKIWVQISKDIIAKLETCLQDSIKQEVIKSMKSYEAKVKGKT